MPAHYRSQEMKMARSITAAVGYRYLLLSRFQVLHGRAIRAR